MASHTQVVEFTLGEEHYCISIEHVDEIIDMDETELTALPDSSHHVEGLLDLRGNTAKIINPKRRFDVGDTSIGNRVIVFEASEEDDYVGWAVDDVEQVSRIQPETVEESDDSDALRGIVNREDGFLLWAKPNLALAN